MWNSGQKPKRPVLDRPLWVGEDIQPRSVTVLTLQVFQFYPHFELPRQQLPKYHRTDLLLNEWTNPRYVRACLRTLRREWNRSFSSLARVARRGSQLNHFQPLYQAPNPLAVAVGLKKVKDEQKEFNAERGWLTIWEPVDKNLGMQGLAVVVNSNDVDKLVEDKLNHLLLLKPRTAFPVSYWAGFAWDRAGKISSALNWKQYVDQFAERLRSPSEVTVK